MEVGKKWNRDFGGAVGELELEGLEKVFDDFSQVLGLGDNANRLRKLFKASYLNNKNLADARRYLVNELFGKNGLVIVDGNSAALKKGYAPYIEQELTEKTTFKNVSCTIEKYPNKYKIQVNPRELNLFYMVNYSSFESNDN